MAIGKKITKVKNKLNNSDVIFISFYTNQGKYPSLKDKLLNSLNNLELKSNIVEVPKFESWTVGNLFKPRFIISQLLKYRKPVVWLDIDIEVLKFPSLLFENHDFAAYNWRADSNHHLEGKIDIDPDTNKLFSAGGVLKFAYTAPSIELLIRWIDVISSSKEKKRDDIMLDLAFNNFKIPINRLWLPKVYNRMDKHTSHWSSIPINEVVINHDYTDGRHIQDL